MNPSAQYGKVILVGAGPGDEGLITVRGMQCLQQADVILYDGLANEGLLRYAKPEATILCVGKHGHGGLWTQKEIDEKTVEFAKQGKQVVRLKGGDTTIFARTSEEIERLIAEGISFEVVPGITAALAVSAYTGIPLTHRDWASAVALITGQLQPIDGDIVPEDELDWHSLAHFRGTLVFYMGVTTAKVWSQKLIQHGKSPSTPVALARRVSWPDQSVVCCELATVASTIEQLKGFRPPVIAIVGDVVNMSTSHDWLSRSSLQGKRLIVASPAPTSDKLSQSLESLGSRVERQPSIEIGDPLDWSNTDTLIRRSFGDCKNWVWTRGPLPTSRSHRWVRRPVQAWRGGGSSRTEHPKCQVSKR
jgi:uroporphyrinogen III methyltransferase / synthase